MQIVDMTVNMFNKL